MNLIKKYWLIILLVFLVIILIFLKIKYSNKTSNETKNIQTKQTEDINVNKNSNNTVTELPNTNNEQNNSNIDINEDNIVDSEEDQSELIPTKINTDGLSPFLPYQGTYFRIERYINTGYLEVIVKGSDNLNKATEEVENWMKEYGTDSQKTKLVFVFE